jgi:hypothetical protein
LALDDDLKVEPGHKDEEDMVVTVGPIGIPGQALIYPPLVAVGEASIGLGPTREGIIVDRPGSTLPKTGNDRATASAIRQHERSNSIL